MPATVFLQTCRQRREVRKATVASLRKSDAADCLMIMEHPPDLERCEFTRMVLAAMIAAPTELVIRCEDDVLVNEHLVHNFSTWPALQHPRFGMGWLWMGEHAHAHCDTVNLDGFRIRNQMNMHGSLAVGFTRTMAAAILELANEKAAEFGCFLEACAAWRGPGTKCRHRNGVAWAKGQHGTDTLFSQAAWRQNKRVFFHNNPVLVEARNVPSIRVTAISSDLRHLLAGPYFKETWRRP